jgi:hypothetical protein
MTVLLLPNKQGAKTAMSSKQGFSAAVLPLGHGSVGVVADSPENLEQMSQLLREQVVWQNLARPRAPDVRRTQRARRSYVQPSTRPKNVLQFFSREAAELSDSGRVLAHFRVHAVFRPRPASPFRWVAPESLLKRRDCAPHPISDFCPPARAVSGTEKLKK